MKYFIAYGLVLDYIVDALRLSATFYHSLSRLRLDGFNHISSCLFVDTVMAIFFFQQTKSRTPLTYKYGKISLCLLRCEKI